MNSGKRNTARKVICLVLAVLILGSLVSGALIMTVGHFLCVKNTAQPSATSRTIMTLNPAAKKTVARLECFPCDISGISSSTTT